MRAAALAVAAAALPARAVADARWPSASSLSARTVAESALRRSVLYEKASGSLLPMSALPAVLGKADRRCILLGEVHDELECHAAQLHALETLRMQTRRPLVVGFEMFYRQHTPVLTAFIGGKLGLDEMLRRVDWQNNWGFPAALYSPLFKYCRQHRIAMVGLNVPSVLVRFVSQVGLAEIGERFPQLRELLPSDIDTTNAEHRHHFLRSMGLGSKGANVPAAHIQVSESSERMDRWYQSQCVWDSVMAESLAAELARDPQACVVALVGSGHMETRTAIPDRTQKLSGVRPFSIVTRPVGWVDMGGVSYPDILAPETGSDLVWYTPRKQDLAS
jgi:uncharacterized iron-regulated protein